MCDYRDYRVKQRGEQPCEGEEESFKRTQEGGAERSVDAVAVSCVADDEESKEIEEFCLCIINTLLELLYRFKPLDALGDDHVLVYLVQRLDDAAQQR